MEKVDSIVIRVVAQVATKQNPSRWIHTTNKLGNRIIRLLDELETIWNTNVLYEEEVEEKGRNRKSSTETS